jgi:hypothetical protein
LEFTTFGLSFRKNLSFLKMLYFVRRKYVRIYRDLADRAHEILGEADIRNEHELAALRHLDDLASREPKGWVPPIQVTFCLAIAASELRKAAVLPYRGLPCNSVQLLIQERLGIIRKMSRVGEEKKKGMLKLLH